MSAATTLWEAAAVGDTHSVRELLEAGVVGGVDAPEPSHHLTALHLATVSQQPQIHLPAPCPTVLYPTACAQPALPSVKP